MGLLFCALFGHRWSPFEYTKMRTSRERRLVCEHRWCTRCPRAEARFMPLGGRR